MARFDPLTAVHFQPRDPGVRFEKDPHIAIDLDHPLDSERILTPNVIHLPQDGYTTRGWGPPDVTRMRWATS